MLFILVGGSRGALPRPSLFSPMFYLTDVVSSQIGMRNSIHIYILYIYIYIYICKCVRAFIQVLIHEPADGEILWTEDIGASFDIVLEIHGGGFNYWDRGARIDADAFVDLDGDEIWHSDGFFLPLAPRV